MVYVLLVLLCTVFAALRTVGHMKLVLALVLAEIYHELRGHLNL